MGKKQYQSQGKYAKKANQAKKKRFQKPNLTSSAGMSTFHNESGEEPAQPAPSGIKSFQQTSTRASYPYLASDLIHTGIIAAIAFVILIILYVVL